MSALTTIALRDPKIRLPGISVMGRTSIDRAQARPPIGWSAAGTAAAYAATTRPARASSTSAYDGVTVVKTGMSLPSVSYPAFGWPMGWNGQPRRTWRVAGPRR